MSNEKYVELAKKLKELAERGVGGEAINARFMLNNLLKKHGITLDEIEEDKVSDHRIKWERSYVQLLAQVTSTVIGKSNVYSRLHNKRTQFFIRCTPAQFIEIEAKACFYLEAYKKEQARHYTAFIYANNLFPANGSNAEPRELSPEELAELRKALALAEQMDKHRYHKQLKKNHETRD